MSQLTLFAGQRLQMDQSIKLTVASLKEYGARHDHWALAWSGGKDSTTLVTLVIWLIQSGQVPAPKSLTVLYADTRMELLPLWLSAQAIRDELVEKGVAFRTVMAEMDKRFLVYILGRGVPPPNNNTLRWCTRQIKIDPMAEEVRRLHGQIGGQKVLMLTGVRVGESAVRDQRIKLSCAGNGAECGQGWYQQALPEQLCATLAPILHWRVCHVWEWLKNWAPKPEFGDWTTELLAEAYGGDEAEEANARTGCVGCPLTESDTATDNLIKRPMWSYLAPLKRLRPIYRGLRSPLVRLRKAGGEQRQDGSLVENQQRMGPITIQGRRDALAQVLAIQDDVNTEAKRQGRPPIDILNPEEVARINELLAANTWPNRWTGNEPLASAPFAPVFADGSSQPLLFGDGE